MIISTKDNSFLSTHVYGDMQDESLYAGKKVGGEDNKYGVSEYIVLDILENKLTGYQGAIYKNQSTGELVAVHRGTEMKTNVSEFVKDTVITDGAMVIEAINTQVPDAMQFMERV